MTVPLPLAPLPGMLQTFYTHGEWYSFPGAGEGVTWQAGWSPSTRVKMTTLVDALAESTKGKASDCTTGIHKCHGAINKSENMKKCAECLRTVSKSDVKKIFDDLLHLQSFTATEVPDNAPVVV